jgi:hypothetical protein
MHALLAAEVEDNSSNVLAKIRLPQPSCDLDERRLFGPKRTMTDTVLCPNDALQHSCPINEDYWPEELELKPPSLAVPAPHSSAHYTFASLTS